MAPPVGLPRYGCCWWCPTLLWWRDSILWVAFMSLYANVASHWAAAQAAEVDEHNQPNGSDVNEYEADLIRKADAGAQLVYALYHAPAAWWTGKDAEMPKSVVHAYMRASDAYRIGKGPLPELNIEPDAGSENP